VAVGRHADAERLYRRSLAGIVDQPDMSKALDALGAMPVAARSHVAGNLNNLGFLYETVGRLPEAEKIHKLTLALREKTFGPQHHAVAQSLSNLAAVYGRQGRREEAAALYQRALAIDEKVLGPERLEIATDLNNLASVRMEAGQYKEAVPLMQRALAIRAKAELSQSREAMITLNNLANAEVLLQDYPQALAFSRRAAGIAVGLLRQNSGGDSAHDLRDFRGGFEINLALIDWMVGRTSDKRDGVNEAFEIAQWATQSPAAVALGQMAVRFSAADPALAAVIRDEQDARGELRSLDHALAAALAAPLERRNQLLIDVTRRNIADMSSRVSRLQARFDRDFPQYAALRQPRPLALAQTEKLLGGDEAIVYLLVNSSETHVFAVTRDTFAWHSVAVGSDAVAAQVARFRRGLDVDQLQKSIDAGAPILFDLDLAHQLYATLLAPVETTIAGKHHLIVVPTGPLTALPFHLLLTKKPATLARVLADMPAYRDAAWLIRRQAVSVLPAVAALKSLRVFASKERGAKPMIAFGDPVFDPTSTPTPQAQRAARANSRASGPRGGTRAYTDFWQGAGVDRAALSKALPALPDTADEIKTVARRVGAPAKDIHLGADASETAVKRAPLADYRIVYFATHGLVAGDIKGLGEPSLALSLPRQASALDDGLLTASEVAQLKLNADWVVLSACNTVAGDKPGAEALSGLARAFFYAGARALLVSHWAVASNAATRLTISTFDALKADPGIGRAEALRRAMVAYLDDTSDPLNANPAFWGPFSLIGEGAGR
ncbi:MAG: CHAT domain-containing protein, partial [Proteobacteria bacterium]|nr:CHAT domain-containing protein [Pseudomonadota bacterium]